jgi:hypothetical protein
MISVLEAGRKQLKVDTLINSGNVKKHLSTVGATNEELKSE